METKQILTTKEEAINWLRNHVEEMAPTVR